MEVFGPKYKRVIDHIGVREVAATAWEDGKAEGKLEGKLEGIAEGLEKGKMQQKQETVLEMHKEGCSIALICKITKLTEAEVMEIISTHGH